MHAPTCTRYHKYWTYSPEKSRPMDSSRNAHTPKIYVTMSRSLQAGSTKSILYGKIHCTEDPKSNSTNYHERPDNPKSHKIHSKKSVICVWCRQCKQQQFWEVLRYFFFFNPSTVDEQLLLFPQCFLLNQIIVPLLSIFLTSYFYLLLNWKSPKLTYEVKGFITVISITHVYILSKLKCITNVTI